MARNPSIVGTQEIEPGHKHFEPKYSTCLANHTLNTKTYRLYVPTSYIMSKLKQPHILGVFSSLGA